MTFPGEQQGRWCIAGKHRAAKLYSGTMASPHSMCAHAQVSLLSEGPCICALLHACLTRLRAPWFQQSHFLSCRCCSKWCWHRKAGLGWLGVKPWRLMVNRFTRCWEPACCLFASHCACCRVPSSSPGTTAMTAHCSATSIINLPEAAIGVRQHACKLRQTDHM